MASSWGDVEGRGHFAHYFIKMADLEKTKKREAYSPVFRRSSILLPQTESPRWYDDGVVGGSSRRGVNKGIYHVTASITNPLASCDFLVVWDSIPPFQYVSN